MRSMISLRALHFPSQPHAQSRTRPGLPLAPLASMNLLMWQRPLSLRQTTLPCRLKPLKASSIHRFPNGPSSTTGTNVIFSAEVISQSPPSSCTPGVSLVKHRTGLLQAIFLVDIFQGSTLNGSRDDFRRFVILVGTQLGFGDLAQSMSESLDVNRKMADEYMRLRDVATTWKQKAKANSKDAREGRKARDELSKAQGDITAILEERDIFIRQRQELLKRDDELTTELTRVHRDYGAAIDDNTKLAADNDALQEAASAAKKQLHGLKDQLSMAEHHRNKAEFDCEQAIFSRDKALADLARDRAFYEARIVALSSPPVPTSHLM